MTGYPPEPLTGVLHLILRGLSDDSPFFYDKIFTYCPRNAQGKTGQAGKYASRTYFAWKECEMSFKKRMLIAFSIVLIMPLVLVMIAFIVIGNTLALREDGKFRMRGYEELADSPQTYEEETNRILTELFEDKAEDPGLFEDRAYLDSLSENLADDGYENVFILVRKNDAIYYTGSSDASQQIFWQLPVYNGKDTADAADAYSYYIADGTWAVRQVDFTFSDGSDGSFFLVSRVTRLVAKRFLIWMFSAMVIIMLVTALFLTQWLQKGVIEPIDQLNTAMHNIRDGNLDYALRTGDMEDDSEIGQLYASYEDMRLRLKENAEEKLEQETQNRELIRNISHDLKTPITSIRGYVEGLLDGVANTPEKQKKYLLIIRNKANDMTNLINELTLYSQIDNDKIPYNFRRLNVSDYFSDCVDEIGIDLESRGIALNYSNLVSPDTQIIADPEQMKRVINNIIGNSIKYMDKPKGRIDIRILDEQDQIRFEIEDNGKGIGAEELPRIFDRFYRTDSSRNSSQGGSGIGLSIVKKIVEDHGGYIWATSTLGQGTCMHFVLRKYFDKTNPDSSVDGNAEEVKPERTTYRDETGAQQESVEDSADGTWRPVS